MVQSIVILGPAHPYRGGGITTFNERLATEFQSEGHEVTIYNFSLQYPSFLFPGKTQYSSEPAPAHLKILRKVNSINPFNWIKVGNELKALRPDIIVVRFWLPLMGPALGTILRKVKKNRHTKIIAITDNIIPHEKRPGDKTFTKYFIKSCDAFITMSDNVSRDLGSFHPDKPVVQVAHPLYDSFGEAIPKNDARKRLGIGESDRVMLFFGFIRKYKGLDLLLDALHLLKKEKTAPGNLKLIIAGEFYEDESTYRNKIQDAGIADMIMLKTGFIPGSKVKEYFCASDMVIQPYRNATQSGVTPLAYHFEIPLIVTNVGALPDYVPDGKAGIVTEPSAAGLAAGILRYFELGEDYFLPQLREEKKKYSWEVFVRRVMELYDSILF